jgi:homoserine dehydrogenase
MLLNAALLGFGNVGRALAELLIEKKNTLLHEYDIDLRIVGIATGSHGQVIDPRGIDLRQALEVRQAGSSLDALHSGHPINNPFSFLADSPIDLLFESTPTNVEDGQPAYAYIFGALERGVHVVTANKGPVAFGYQELTALARRKNVGFLFESTVMDGAPVLAVGREGLPANPILRTRGILNSTTNYILTRMEQDNLSFDAALEAAQAIGIAETDPTLDIDGWDSAIKTVILANVLMGADLRPMDVVRQGIRHITLADVEEARAAGQRIRLICEAERQPDGNVTASVEPRTVAEQDILASVTGTSSIVDFETETLPRVTVVEHNPGPTTTAYGMLADMINILRGRHLTDIK